MFSRMWFLLKNVLFHNAKVVLLGKLYNCAFPFHFHFPDRITTTVPKTATLVTRVTASFLALAHEPVTRRLASARARLAWLGDNATSVITPLQKWPTPAVRVCTYNMACYPCSPAVILNKKSLSIIQCLLCMYISLLLMSEHDIL